MNVMSVLNQIMQQAQGAQGTGNRTAPPGAGGEPGMNIDLKSLLGGGALGLLLGSKGGRKLGGKALKYGALAGVGALAWKAYQDSDPWHVCEFLSLRWFGCHRPGRPFCMP